MCYNITNMGVYDCEESCTFKESPLINLQGNGDTWDGWAWRVILGEVKVRLSFTSCAISFLPIEEPGRGLARRFCRFYYHLAGLVRCSRWMFWRCVGWVAFSVCHVFCCGGISLMLTVYAVFHHDGYTGVCALLVACNPIFVTRFALKKGWGGRWGSFMFR